MPIKYLKKAKKSSSTDDQKTREIVENILRNLENLVRLVLLDYKLSLHLSFHFLFLVGFILEIKFLFLCF